MCAVRVLLDEFVVFVFISGNFLKNLYKLVAFWILR